MSIVYQCDRCKRTFPDAAAVTNVRGVMKTEMQADLCDRCMGQLLNRQTCDSEHVTPQEVHFRRHPNTPYHEQLDLTGIAPEDRDNLTGS